MSVTLSEPLIKRSLITLILGGLVAILLAVVLVRILGEEGAKNSYALMAGGWLDGRLDASRCFDLDCALFEGRTYVIFPPAPALLVLPFVALFGEEFAGFFALSAVLAGLSGLMWWQIFRHCQGASRTVAALLVVAVLFATPLYSAVIRGDGVWFFAQTAAFFFVTAAFWCALKHENAVLAGCFIGLAFLSRQMTIFYMPFLLVLMLPANKALYKIDLDMIKLVARLSVGPLLAFAAYFTLNYLRFGDPLETGYQYIFPEATQALSDPSSLWLQYRVHEIGLFSPDFLVFNLIHMFFQGPHVEFGGRYLLDMVSQDPMGYAMFIGAPFLLFMFLAPFSRLWLAGFLTSLFIMILILFYHSNGYSQFSTQRYILDWLPIMLLVMVGAMQASRLGIFALLLAQALLLSVGTVVVAFLVS